MSNLQKVSDWQSQMELVKSICAPTATNEEFALMCHMATRYGFDPLVKQIWVIKYGDKPAQIFAGRDGFLSVAHRSGVFNGMSTMVEKVQEPIDVKKKRYDRFKKEWIVMDIKRDWQFRAVCTIHRKDAEHPFVVEVLEEEYTTCENLWVDKPRTMLGKVAESQCLRKAFDISGIYSPEEMPEHTERDVTPTSEAQKKFEAEKGINVTPAQPVEIIVPESIKKIALGSFSHDEMVKATQGADSEEKILYNLSTIFYNRELERIKTTYAGKGMNISMIKAHVAKFGFNWAKIEAAFGPAGATIADVAKEDRMPDDFMSFDDEGSK